MSEGANKAQDAKKLYAVRFSEKQARQKSNIWSSGEAVREVSRNWKLLPYITLIR